MVTCPYCGFEGDDNDFELIKGPWQYSHGRVIVKRLRCPRCGNVFNKYTVVKNR